MGSYSLPGTTEYAPVPLAFTKARAPGAVFADSFAALRAGSCLMQKRFLRMANRCSLVPVLRRPHAGRRWRKADTGCATSPSNCPWTRPAMHLDGTWVQLSV